jgi:hypothetical protein
MWWILCVDDSVEIRSIFVTKKKFETNPKIKCPNVLNRIKNMMSLAGNKNDIFRIVLNFEFLSLVIVSGFEIRYSDFR